GPAVFAHDVLARLPLLLDDLACHVDQILQDLLFRPPEGYLVRKLKDVALGFRSLAVQSPHREAELRDDLEYPRNLPGHGEGGQMHHQGSTHPGAYVRRTGRQIPAFFVEG